MYMLFYNSTRNTELEVASADGMESSQSSVRFSKLGV